MIAKLREMSCTTHRRGGKNGRNGIATELNTSAIFRVSLTALNIPNLIAMVQPVLESATNTTVELCMTIIDFAQQMGDYKRHCISQTFSVPK